MGRRGDEQPERRIRGKDEDGEKEERGDNAKGRKRRKAGVFAR